MAGAGGSAPAGRARLYAYTAGFYTQKRIRRILHLAGYDLRAGLPGPQDPVAVWGAGPRAARGLAVAARRGAPVLRVEDAFLRSLHPGRQRGEPPLGLVLDRSGLHFDAAQPSDLERILAEAPLDDTPLLDRARDAMARIRAGHLSKYSATRPDIDPPPPGYVLVIDQTRGDASVTANGGDRARFLEMLFVAREENPGARILIRTHPETAAGLRPGHYRPEDATGPVSLCPGPVSPWALLDGAVAVYTLSSQMGFEAILAGHRPRVFGQPFYAGWGLSADETPVARRRRALTRPQLFAGAMMLYPRWYDPFRDRLCEIEDVLAVLEAQVRAWREDRAGWTAGGIRAWKRPHMQRFFGGEKPVRFEDAAPSPQDGRRHMVWGAHDRGAGTVAVEDGFVRSRGLGAELVPPLSLVLDDLGIYFDPTRPSRLEALIDAAASGLRTDQRRRAERLIAALREGGLSKYNLAGPCPDLPAGVRLLVVGQVEDDASIRLGTGEIATNQALLQAARVAHPDAVIVYKPHPDVDAGLRPGAIDATGLADVIAAGADPVALLDQVDAVWTMTSTLGFEALLRGVTVTTLGTPFYAGWGLSEDLGKRPARRAARPDLVELVHAVLIDYPRYVDPVTGMACPVEAVVDRLRHGPLPRPGPANRMLAKLQGVFAGRAPFWR